MTSIYDKALKRKDLSGVTNKDKEEASSRSSECKFFPESAFFYFIHTLVDKTKAQKKDEKDKVAKADDPKGGADVGKIVNLIAGDSIRVRNIICFSRLLSSSFSFLDLSNDIFALFSLRRYI
jgi:hypothetical protein